MHRMMHRGRGRFGGQGGFTLFEVIVVLLILGVISYFASARLFTDDGISQVSEKDLIKNHLRYAQARAMNTELDWGILFESANRYFLFRGDAPGVPVRLPGDESADGKMTLRSITVTDVINAAPSRTVRFRSLEYGSPGSLTITVVTTGGNITVTKNTGFIP
jgi:prepilin-type N-terminal cleavage/methylation domain-containing protein